jgi:transposase
MDKTGVDSVLFTGTSGSLTISAEDEVARKFAMLIEGKCLGLGPSKAAEKYGYTKQRFFQLLAAFEQDGSSALMSKQKGPKTNYVRTENVVSQVIRHRFLDPDANAAVIAQKMTQTGIKVSQRSVERIIAEHGLQKKSSISSVPKTNRKRLKSSIPKNERKR